MKLTIAFIALLNLACAKTFAQPPLVYSKENTGANFALPPLPDLNQLPIVDPLPDPFMWSNGSGRSTKFSDWEKRRNEIKAEVEHYEIAAYGTLAAYAKTLNHREALDLLLLTLGEEKKSDCLLSTIADTNLNSQAMAGEFKPKKIKAV